MIIRQLLEEEIKDIYQERMPDDFAKGEIKPLERILSLWKRNKYFCYGIFEEGQPVLISYCFVVASDERDAVLLDYFAVSRESRGRGVGSLSFALLKKELEKEKLGTLILEVENPRFGADEEDKKLRRRRIAFYIRNGMTLTHLRVFLYGVEYLVMTADKHKMLETESQIYHVYRVLLKPDKIKSKLNISSNIRCLAVDLDKAEISGEDRKKAIREAAGRGIHIVVISEKDFSGLPEEIMGIKGVEYAVIYGGAVIYHREGEKKFIEVACGNTSKVEGLMWVLNRLGLEPEECMQGDSILQI